WPGFRLFAKSGRGGATLDGSPRFAKLAGCPRIAQERAIRATQVRHSIASSTSASSTRSPDFALREIREGRSHPRRLAVLRQARRVFPDCARARNPGYAGASLDRLVDEREQHS